MRGDVVDFVAACSVCAQAKDMPPVPHTGYYNLSPSLTAPGHTSLWILFTDLPPSRHYMTNLTIVDRFSKAVHFIPLTKLPSASDTAQLLVTHVVRLHGIPAEIVSDRGPQFTACFWRAFCTLLGTQVSLSSGFHPQSNGQTERVNQSLETVLRCLCAQESCVLEHPTAVGGIRHQLPDGQLLLISPLLNVASGTSPHCFPARNCRWESRRQRRLSGGASGPGGPHAQTCRRQRPGMKQQADRRRRPTPVYRVGQRVWLSTKDIPIRGGTRKLAPWHVGPFVVSRIISPTAVRLRLPPTMRRIHPTFHVSRLKPAVTSPLCSAPPQSSAPPASSTKVRRTRFVA